MRKLKIFENIEKQDESFLSKVVKIGKTEK